jgi:hypothetical protein
LIGTIKARSDEVDARLNGLFVGTNTQRNRNERFPLNAAPSVLDFMKKFSPESDKPGAPSAAKPADMPRPTTRAEYDALPSGTKFIAPDGSVHIKN